MSTENQEVVRTQSELPAALSPTIMIVDDEPLNIKIVRKYLQMAGYQNFVTLTDSVAALQTVREKDPDVILLDVMMPQVSGLDILKEIRADEKLTHIPVLILTASTDFTTKMSALELGATDFLAKPIDPNELMPRIRNALVVKAHHDHLAQYSQQLEHEVRMRTVELEASHMQVVHCLARAAEYRDDDTGRHVMRVGRFCGIIARQLGLDEERAGMIELAALLHDVGKIGIPDRILLKPGRLDPDEFATMQKHCEYGNMIIEPLPEHADETQRMTSRLGVTLPLRLSSPLLSMAATIALTHHEKWDGTGYPRKLAGEKIPLEGRITAVADVFDALSSKRPYKQPFALEQCLTILRDGRGKQFDAEIVNAFLARLGDITQVQQQYADAA